MPNRIRMMPPAICALFPNLLPKMLPTLTPTVQNTQVNAPINRTADTMLTLPAIAREIPTARASIEVAIIDEKYVLLYEQLVRVL